MSNRLEALGLRGREFDEAMQTVEAEQEQAAREERKIELAVSQYSGPIIHARGLQGFSQPMRGNRPIPPIIIPIPSRRHRFRDWLLSWVHRPGRVKRTVGWWVALPFRGWEVARVVFGGNVDAPHYRNRMQACETCPERILDMKPSEKHKQYASRNEAWDEKYGNLRPSELPDEAREEAKDLGKLNLELGEIELQNSYCRPCGCPKWPLSRLAYKNRKVQWSCPMRRFEEGYPDDAIRLTLKGLEYVPAGHLDHHASGCGGCGGAGTNGSAKRMDEAAVAELGG